MWVHTFHALGVRLLREFGPLARVQPGFTIYDENDSLRVIKQAMELAGVPETVLRPDRAAAEISRAKNRLETPAELAARADRFDEQAAARVYAAYEELLQQRNAVDFDDLLMRVALVLQEHPDIVERLNLRFRYLLIDEYQDTNHAQYLIAHHLSAHHRNICATGDPDQSIYGWRGADLNNILDFEKDYPDAVVVRLEQNYRSTGAILQAASRLIAANRRRKHKDLWTTGPVGEPVRLWRFDEGRAEAERIGATIAEWHARGRPYSDFAIFYRVNALSRGLEEALRARGIPYQIARGVEFYNRKEIKDTLAYLRVIVNPADELALRRILNTPPRGIGPKTIQRLLEVAGRTERPLLEILRRIREFPELQPATGKIESFLNLLDRIKAAAAGSITRAVGAVLELSGLEAALEEEREEGGEDRLANVQELVTAARRYEEEAEEPTLEEFLQRVALVSDQDAVDETAGAVMLMTLHAAKGLEFPVVFLVGLEQGLLPHENALREGLDIEEERRLCFVGLTRAREHLFVSYARERLVRGVRLPRAPSQFLGELGGDAVISEDFCEPWRPPARRWRESAEHPAPDQDGFVPLDDQLSEDERGMRLRRRRRTCESADEEDLNIIDAAREGLSETSPYADWRAGTLVQHEQYGIGQVVWIRPGGGQTRASIRFARYGEKTFILELSPIRKLERS